MKKKKVSSELESLSQSKYSQQEKMLEAEIKQREASVKQMELSNVGNRIEHARRNVEVVSRVVGLFQDEIKKKMVEVLMLNLEVLKETSKL